MCGAFVGGLDFIQLVVIFFLVIINNICNMYLWSLVLMCSGDISSLNSRGSSVMSACSIFSSSLLMPFQNISNFGFSNLVHTIQCSTCKKIYIGETGNTLRCRMYQHNHHIKKQNKSTMLCNHFKNLRPTKIYTHGPGEEHYLVQA